MCWYFQQIQCLNIKITCSTQHKYINLGPYVLEGPRNCLACTCVKTALSVLDATLCDKVCQ